MMSEKRREDVTRRIQTLAKFAPLAGASILEVGADSDGIASAGLLGAGAAKVFSTNFGSSWLDSNTSDRHEYLTADARHLLEVFEPRSVDIVFGIAVLEHIDGLDDFFDGAARVLRPGGVFFVHGGPIWSSANGHHVHVKGEKMHYRFGVPGTNPIPPWRHLIHTRESLKQDLISRAIPAGDAENISAWIYESKGINRVGYRSMRDSFDQSPLNFVDELVAAFRPPDQDLMSAIKRGRYGDQERYDISGCTFVARAPLLSRSSTAGDKSPRT